jgi:hypothetical protein
MDVFTEESIMQVNTVSHVVENILRVELNCDRANLICLAESGHISGKGGLYLAYVSYISSRFKNATDKSRGKMNEFLLLHSDYQNLDLKQIIEKVGYEKLNMELDELKSLK